MTRQSLLEHSAAATDATAAANSKNTSKSHNDAAALHRIASEAAGLTGDDTLKNRHSDLAIQHGAAAQRCAGAESNKVEPADLAAPAATTALVTQ